MVNSEYLFVGLFALDFLIVGIVSTMAMSPLLGFKEIIRKLSHIIPFGLIFSLLSTAIVYYRNMSASSILIVLSIIGIIILMIAYIRKQNHDSIKLKILKNILKNIYEEFICPISHTLYYIIHWNGSTTI